jgi:hypothetical protein
MSASRSPTLNPIFASETDRFEVTVDFPTPPFPDAIAIIFFIPEIFLAVICVLCFCATTFLKLIFTLNAERDSELKNLLIVNSAFFLA